MLVDVVQRQAAIAWQRSTLFAPYLDEYLDELRPLGHGSVSFRNHLLLVTRLGEYLATRRVHDVAHLRQEHVADFVRRERHRRENLQGAAQGIRTDAPLRRVPASPRTARCVAG